MSFKALLALAAQTNFTIGVSATGPNKDVLSLIFAPATKDGQDPVLANPFRLAGTVEELDANFESHMNRILGARQTLTETADAAVAIMEAATKAQAEKAQADKSSKGKGANNATPAALKQVKAPASPTGDEDRELDDENDDAGAAPASQNVANTAVDTQTGNLFGSLSIPA